MVMTDIQVDLSRGLSNSSHFAFLCSRLLSAILLGFLRFDLSIRGEGFGWHHNCWKPRRKRTLSVTEVAEWMQNVAAKKQAKKSDKAYEAAARVD